MNFHVPELVYSSAAAYGTATEAQTHIDEEMRKLRGLRNTFSPTCRFPPEILAIIFIRCATDHHHQYRNPIDVFLPPNDPSKDVPSWVNVSYVCRYWRDVVLDCPALWSHHFVASLRWTEELLARSKQAPLKIYLRINYDESDSRWLCPVEKLMKHAERLEDFSLHVDDRHASRVISMLSEPSRAPCLQNLTISTFFSLSEQPFLPFHGDAPALRTLDFSYCLVLWRSFNLSSLTTLNLAHLPSQFRENTEDILAILRDMGNLTELCLDNVLASAVGFISSPAFHSFQNVNLPHLSRLSIDAPLLTAIAFLFHVNLPLKPTVRLTCSHEDGATPKGYTLLSLVLTRRLGMFQDQPKIRSLIIKFSGGLAQVIFSSLERDCDGFQYSMTQDQYWSHSIPFSVSSCWGLSIVSGDHFISNILCSIPLTNVQTLRINSPPYSSAFWGKMLGHLQDLRYISLIAGQMPDLASVLSVMDPVTRDDVENQVQVRAVSVPQLEELKLSHLRFSSEGDSNLLEPAITLRQLFDALSTRNAPHGRLDILNCKVEGSSDLPDMVRSWDDLTDIPVVLANESDSYEESGSEVGRGDDWDSDVMGIGVN